MTQPKDIEGLRKVAEEAISAYPYVRYQFAAQNADVERTRATRYAKAIAKRVARALLSELEAVKGENAGAVWDENAECFYTAEHLKRLLDSRDAFLAKRGLFTEYADSIGDEEAALVSLKGGGGSSVAGIAGGAPSAALARETLQKSEGGGL